MKKALLASLAIALAYAATASPAFAQVLYTSGSSTHDNSAILISLGDWESDSFVPTESGTATSVEFVAWLYFGDSLTDVDWSIGTAGPDSSNLGSGTVDPSATYIETLANFGSPDIDTETFTISGISLTAGDTYYLTLQNAISSTGDPVYWDLNDNYNTGYTGTTSFGLEGAIPASETFEILSTTSATPEPSTLLLLATGLLGLGLPLAARARRTLPARP